MTLLGLPFFMFWLLGGIGSALVLISGIWVHRERSASKLGFVAALAPNALFLLLFYSLQVHMYRSLGGWPQGIGEVGFSDALKVHCAMTMDYLIVLLLVFVFAGPVLFTLFAIIRPLRIGLLYLGVYAVGFLLAFILIFVSPSGFLEWWFD